MDLFSLGGRATKGRSCSDDIRKSQRSGVMSGEPLVHDLVSLCGARNPGALAVSSLDAELTYGSLEQRSNQLAHRLRGSGVISP